MFVFSFTSCTSGNVSDKGMAKIVIETQNAGDEKHVVYEVDLSKLEKHDEGVLSLLEYLAVQENSNLSYSANWGGGYGAYINSISSLYPDPSKNQYIAVYTSEECDFAVPNEYAPIVAAVEFNGEMLSYAGVGISEMTVKDETVILFRLESY